MDQLIHYVFVRKDLPLGILTAMIVHAAGESGALYQDEQDGRFRGATAVVLEATDEPHLERIDEYLHSSGIRRVCVFESSEPYSGQVMAIGVVPGLRTKLGSIMAKFQTLKGCLDNPTVINIVYQDPNEAYQATKATTNVLSEG